MATDLEKLAKDRGIKYFLISFTDLFGAQRSKLVPASAINAMAKTGAGFAGFATWLDMTPADADMFVIPDPDSLIQLPWKPEVGWFAGNAWMNGKEVEHAPRNVLRRMMAAAADKGFEMKTGVECEFHLIAPDASGISDAADRQAKPCYDQGALMRRYDVIGEICDAMLALGWKPYQNDHEDANGQFEMNWEYDNALVTADRHSFFKYMVKSIAEKHGMRATFMPKPFTTLTGNGCHTHVSLWKDGANLFADPAGELGVSRLCYQFLAGILAHAEALTAITNPMVNSYKRINAPVTLSGATWSPNTITYTGNNRTHMIRIPACRTVRPIPICCRPRSWLRGWTASPTTAIPASGWTSTCTPMATWSRAPRSCRSTCWMRCARLARPACSRRRSGWNSSPPMSSSRPVRGMIICAT
jgi:glutamine synthetase